MGKYRATMNLGGHRRGEIREYDEGDPILKRRVDAGFLVLVGVPKGAKPVLKSEPSNPEVEVETSPEAGQPVDNSVDNSEEPEVKPAPAKKRAPAKKKPVVEEPVAEEPVADESSVQTSWYISPTTNEG
jgi:hypothetical protein